MPGHQRKAPPEGGVFLASHGCDRLGVRVRHFDTFRDRLRMALLSFC